MGNEYAKTERQQLIEGLQEATRQQSTWTVMFHNAVAEKVGLNITDHKSLDILLHQGPLTAGQLAEITALTTGAVTGVIDRLEKAGYVRREQDPTDRRRVIVAPVLDRPDDEMRLLFSHFLERYNPLLDSYKDEELRLILRFVEESISFMRDEINWLRSR